MEKEGLDDAELAVLTEEAMVGDAEGDAAAEDDGSPVLVGEEVADSLADRVALTEPVALREGLEVAEEDSDTVAVAVPETHSVSVDEDEGVADSDRHVDIVAVLEADAVALTLPVPEAHRDAVALAEKNDDAVALLQPLTLELPELVRVADPDAECVGVNDKLGDAVGVEAIESVLRDVAVPEGDGDTVPVREPVGLADGDAEEHAVAEIEVHGVTESAAESVASADCDAPPDAEAVPVAHCVELPEAEAQREGLVDAQEDAELLRDSDTVPVPQVL